MICLKITPEVDKHLQSILSDESKYESLYWLDLMRLAESLQTTEDKVVLTLLGKAMKLGYDDSADNPFFSDSDIHSDENSSYVKRRHFDDAYFSDSDYENLEDFLPNIKHPVLTARICDLLWTLKGNHSCAAKAIDAYKECSEATFDVDNWTTCFGHLKKSARIARSLGKNTQQYKDFCAYIDSIIRRIDGTDPLFLSISLIELLLDSGYRELADYVTIADKIIVNACGKSSLRRTETAFELKIKLLHKLGNNEAKLVARTDYAQHIESLAKEHHARNTLTDTQHAIHYYEKAVLLYREAMKPNNVQRVRLILEPIKRTYAESMPYVSQTIDRKPTYDWLHGLMAHRSFAEKIVIMSLLTRFRSKQKLEESVLTKHREFVFSSMFGSVVLDNDGKSIINIPPLDMHAPKADIPLLEMHMHREATTLQSYEAMIDIDMALQIIQETHGTVRLEDFVFLIDDNFLVPEDRKHIFKLGIMHGINGDYYAALHLLAPQVENLFREITTLCGGLVTTFEDDATEQLKALSKVFDSPELKDCYDENVLFIFKGLLNEKSGANLRNRVAHGITGSVEGNSPLAMYFLAAVIKLCSWYSRVCLKIIPTLIRELEESQLATSQANE